MKLSRTASARTHTCRPESTGIVRGTPRKSGANLDPDLAKWCEALAFPTPLDTVPPGWLTVQQLADKLGVPRRTIGERISNAVREGRAERQMFRISTGAVTRPIPHYRLK